MRYNFLCLLLLSCTSQSVTPRTGDILLAPLSVKNAPKAFSQNGFDSFAFEWRDRKFRMYLAPVKVPELDANMQRMYGFGPVIEVREEKQVRVLDLREKLPTHCFAHVFHDQWNKRIFALTQACVEGPASAFTVWISENGGDSWFQGADLERPSPRFPPSDLYTIFVDKLGKGEAWFRINADHFSSSESFAKDMADGQELIYKLSTADGGRSWSAGREPYGKNGMIEVKRAQ